MKLNTSLLQAIALGVTLTAVSITSTSCEKEVRKTEENGRDGNSSDQDDQPSEPCPMCGMG